MHTTDYRALNALLNSGDTINYESDKEATKQYFLQHVNQNTVFFHTLEEKLDYLVTEGFYRSDVIEKYPMNFIKSLYKKAYAKKFRFKSFMGAFKYYSAYTMKTLDGERYLERFEDRVCMVAMTLGNGDQELAVSIMEEIISGVYQPATPTFLNAGKIRGGELVSCFLVRVEDNMESIGRSINTALQLSKRGGGVALLLTNVRETGAPIKEIENMSSGVVPVMKILEDSFSYANQLGARQGAGAVYLNAHHPDIMEFLDTKKENADEKIRIKTLSLGVVVPDITFELAKRNEMMYLFSPYDVEKEYGKPFADISITEEYVRMVENPRIKKKKISARAFFQKIAELQTESGYPYLLFEDTATRENPTNDKINMSNLCVKGDSMISISSDERGENSTDVTLEEFKDILKSGVANQKFWVKSHNGLDVVWKKITAMSHNKRSKFIRIEDEGKILEVTPDHEIWTKNRGWVEAQNLIETDELEIDLYK